MEEVFYKYIFGYEIKIRKKETQYIAEILDLKIKKQSQSKGRAIREVFDEIKDRTNKGNIKPNNKKNTSYYNNLQIRIFKINQKITKFGFSVISEDISEIDLVKLESLCDNIDITKNYSIKDTEKIEDKIITILEPYIIDPHLRALNMCSLIMNTNHISKFSHIIEQSYISLFRGEYISTVMILTPVIEGILLSLYGFNFRNKKLKDQKLLNKWAELQYEDKNNTIHSAYIIDEYIRAFLDISEQMIFSKHQIANQYSYFNRNYIAHVMGDGKFYSRKNAYKLINLIDLMAHVLATCNNQHNRYAYDRENIEYKMRVYYYSNLIEKRDIEEVQRHIMHSHNNFKGYI